MSHSEADGVELAEQERSEFDLDPATELQQGFVDFFSDLARAALLPKSVGEIYGLLYASSKPLAVPEIMARLGVSKATVSQSMRLLHELQAVRVSKRPGLRHDFFSAETSLRRVVQNLLTERVQPSLADRAAALESLEDSINDADLSDQERTFFRQRSGSLGQWYRRTQLVLPLLRRMLRVKD